MRLLLTSGSRFNPREESLVRSVVSRREVPGSCKGCAHVIYEDEPGAEVGLCVECFKTWEELSEWPRVAVWLLAPPDSSTAAELDQLVPLDLGVLDREAADA